MASITNTFVSLLSLGTALVSASPVAMNIDSHTKTARAPSNETTGRIWQPTMYNIYPQAPEVSKPAVTGLHIETFEGKSQLEQVAVFTGIPAGAKNCMLGWSQADKEDRVFVVKGGTGLTRIRQLSGLPAPADGISFSSMQPYDDAPQNDDLGPDFTFWDDEQYDATEHSAGGVDCAESIYLRVALRDPATKASLYLGQDEKNGLWVEYQV